MARRVDPTFAVGLQFNADPVPPNAIKQHGLCNLQHALEKLNTTKTGTARLWRSRLRPISDATGRQRLSQEILEDAQGNYNNTIGSCRTLVLRNGCASPKPDCQKF